MYADSIKVVTANMEIVVDLIIMIKYVNFKLVKRNIVKNVIQDHVLISMGEDTANSMISANLVTRKVITPLI